jgi:hypothetical protein
LNEKIGGSMYETEALTNVLRTFVKASVLSRLKFRKPDMEPDINADLDVYALMKFP